MRTQKIKISPFNTSYQPGIDQLMLSITKEFSNPLATANSKKIIDKAALFTHKYWVALDETKVIGTVGLTTLENHSIGLKSMFLAAEYRGLGVGDLLLDCIKKWCRDNQYHQIYLGTMTQFKAGQRFYEKNKFLIIHPSNLPKDFTINPIDSLFYLCTLK